MSRLLVCGPCPLPFENVSRTYGTGIRTWQLAWSLAQSGHEVRLVALATDGAYGGDEKPPAHEVRERVEILRLSYAEVMDPSLLRRRIADFSPDAVVGSTIYGSFALAQCRPRLPFWADHFGDAMAEAQAKAKLEGRNWPLAHFWRFAEPALRRADRISAVSEPQRHALVGELAALGRLTAETCGYELTAVIPCGAQPTLDRPPRETLRQGRFAADDFLLLWSGTFNVWADVDTLFAAVAGAMEANPKIHLLVTGGAIEGHDEETYSRLRRLVEASPHRERFHFEGWVAAERLPLYEATANLAVLSELPIYEGMLGSKNRTVRWLAQ
ncbi:MAG TPA: glycosyltransferase, partial [Thermoanaerobaculia bacterium]|nr:glycosyltransferase [Thermoanaerobaculia bacterium]